MANKDKMLNLPWQIGREFTVYIRAEEKKRERERGWENFILCEMKCVKFSELEIINKQTLF
jgi:hypothetical protein